MFEGGWSYTQKEMTKLFGFIDEYITDKTCISVLEFGAGDSSLKLYKYLQNIYSNVHYDCFESDPFWAVKDTCITTYMYNEHDIDPVQTPDKIYDLILVDGPAGVNRSKWYNKITKNVRNGTILLIDDFSHYKEFDMELNNNFEYETLDVHDIPFVPGGEHSWKIVKIIKKLSK